MSDPVKVFTFVVLLSLPTVMFGGFSLLRLYAAQKLTDFQRTYFRAGHAHAGVLLVLALAALDVMGRTDLGTGAQWALGAILAVGILAQSGGMFVHMAVGSRVQDSPAGGRGATRSPRPARSCSPPP